MTIDITRLRELLDKSLGRAYSLGQTYWMQADSESYSQNRKADETQTKFDRMRAETNVEFAALLDELERLRFQISEFREDGSAAVRFAPSSAHWSNELRRLFGEDARQGIDSLEARLRKAESALESKEAEVARLRQALAELVVLEADGRHASESSIECWERARAALSGPTTNEGA